MASPFQFSIRSLLLAVLILAVGIVALLNANLWWEAAAWSVALFLLACAILLVVYRRDEQRAYWLGFAIFGGLYLSAFLFVALFDWQAGLLGGASVQYNSFVTTRISQFVYGVVIPESRRAEYLSADGNPTSLPPPFVYGYSAVVPAPVAGSTYTPPPLPPPMPPTSSALTSNPSYVPLEKFVSIAHSLWLLLAAAIGGKVCQWIHRTRPREQPNATT